MLERGRPARTLRVRKVFVRKAGGTPALRLLVLEIRDLAVRALLPGVEDVTVLLFAADQVAVVGDVALLVERDVAQYGLEGLAGVHDLGDLLGVERFRLLGRLLDDLDGGVAVERIGLRLEALLAERRDDVLVAG